MNFNYSFLKYVYDACHEQPVHVEQIVASRHSAGVHMSWLYVVALAALPDLLLCDSRTDEAGVFL